MSGCGCEIEIKDKEQQGILECPTILGEKQP